MNINSPITGERSTEETDFLKRVDVAFMLSDYMLEPVAFSNKSSNHATILIHRYLLHTKSKLRILSRCMKLVSGKQNYIWGDPEIQKALEKLLMTRGVNIEILVHEDIDEKSGITSPLDIIKSVSNLGKLQASCYVGKINHEDESPDVNASDDDTFDVRSCDVLLCDNQHIRTEFGYGGTNAQVLFKADEELVSEINALFDKLKQQSNPLF